MGLSPADLEMFEGFGVDAGLVRRAGIVRVSDAEARQRYGFAGAGDMAGIVFPYFDPASGSRITARLRRDHPEPAANGKLDGKYLSPYGDNRRLFFAPGAAALLTDVGADAVLVEAEKSALAIAALAERSGRKVLSIACGGCWGWRGKTGIEASPSGEREETRGPLPDFERISWLRRKAVIAFDANVTSNRKVQTARRALADTLTERGARVHFCHVPQESGVNGPDDYLQVRGDRALLALIDAARAFRPVPGVLASEVMPEKVEWIWKGYIPRGKPTIFEGDPDEGKSTLALDIAARVSRGFTMPDGLDGIEAAGAVIVSLEDGAADTIVPRLIAAGADRSRIRIVQTIEGADGMERTPTLPGDLPAIEAAIKDVGAAVLVIDPLVATLAAETNSYRDQDIRRVMAPVAALAEKTGAAAILIRHLNKGSNPNPKYRGGGSIGIIGAARAAFLFGPNPDEEGSKVMAPVKNNLCAKPPSLKYRIQECDGAIAIAWEGETSHTARSILAEPETQEESSALADAKSFLIDALSGGAVDSNELKCAARRAGISERTLFRAKPLIGVTAKRDGFGKGARYTWELPCSAKEPPCTANINSLAEHEQDIETKPVISTHSPCSANGSGMAEHEPTLGRACAYDAEIL
jgi:hypothetical protein